MGKGGGARPEGAVHEGFQKAGVQEGVVFGVAGTAGLKNFKGEGEVDPFRDAKLEFVGVLHGFEGEEVVPVGEVLDGGDAVGESVGDGDLESAAAVFGGRRGYFAEDEIGRGGFAEDARRGSSGVAVDLRAGGIGGGGGDVRQGEGDGVGDGHVAVGAPEDGWVVGGDLVEVLAGGELFAGPDGVIPASALEPCAGRFRGGVDLDLLEHGGKSGNLGEVDGQFLLAGCSEVDVSVVEAGEGEGLLQIDQLSVVGLKPEDFGV